jgi:hypothetical protein
MDTNNNIGYINIWIDETVACLRDAVTGEEKDTVVYQVKKRSELKGYNKKSGWYTNWHGMPKDAEIYALAIKGEKEIQGLIALKNDTEAEAAYLHWGCAAPHNNKLESEMPKYVGVGGHLFAIAADISIRWGYDGAMYGYAANKKLVEHYVSKFGALWVGFGRSFQFVIDPEQAKNIAEVYTYEWDDSQKT